MNKEDNMNLTLKEICNYIAAMNCLVEEGIVKFDKDKAYVEFDADGCISYLEKQNIELQQKVNQLETNRDAIRELLHKNITVFDGATDKLHIQVKRIELNKLLEGGKE